MHFVSILLAILPIGLPLVLAQSVFPAPISLINTTYAGTGCPANSLTSAFNPTTLALQFSATRYNVTFGKNSTAVQNRKNCQIRAAILVPANYTISVVQNQVSGTAKLSENVTAQFLTNVYLSSKPEMVRIVSLNLCLFAEILRHKSSFVNMVNQLSTFRETLKGPADGPFAKKDELEFESAWTPCEGGVATFNIVTQIRLDLTNKTVSDGTGAIEADFAQSYGFSWYKCSK